MPNLPKTVCNYSRCSASVANGQRYCDSHKKHKPGNQSQSHPWYHIPRYRRARDRYVKENPRCECGCDRLIQDISKRHLDHKIPFETGNTIQEQRKLFWDKDNWQVLYESCHMRKTRTQNAR